MLFLVDLKKMIAYSTIYQISSASFVIMFIDPVTAILFLEYHMFYKATLFMTTGIIIHTNWCSQDYRMFTLRRDTHISTITLTGVLTFASCSLWLTLGYYAKEAAIDDITKKLQEIHTETLLTMITIIAATIVYSTFIGGAQYGSQQAINLQTHKGNDTETTQNYCILAATTLLTLTTINFETYEATKTTKTTNTTMHANYTNEITTLIVLMYIGASSKQQLNIVEEEAGGRGGEGGIERVGEMGWCGWKEGGWTTTC
jgi:NADH:ubiquinone oxidoreductase subunit 5 (subunit L)/multisubunit Na+/H+ antiporter MnhA subunit